MLRHLGGLLFIAVALLACDVESMAPKEDLEFAKHYFSLFQSRDFNAIEAQLDPKLKSAQLRSNLTAIAAYFPADATAGIETVRWDTNFQSAVTTEAFQFHYRYPRQVLLAEIVFEKRDGRILVTGVHVTPLPEAPKGAGGLSLDDMTAGKWAFLILALAVPVFILFSIVVCIRTKMPKWKWLWIVFMLFGVVSANLNWSTGAVNIQLLNFLLFGAGWYSGGLSVPTVSVSIPLGAILFLLLRGRWRRKAQQETLKEF